MGLSLRQESMRSCDQDLQHIESSNIAICLVPRLCPGTILEALLGQDSIGSGVELEKSLHDEVYRVLIYVKIFPSLCENRLPHERSIDGGNLKCRKIDGIVMPCAEFVRYGPKSGLGVAARADHVEIVAKRGPEVYGRDCDNQFTCRVMNGHDCMNALQILEVLGMPAHPERIAAHVSAFVDIGA